MCKVHAKVCKVFCRVYKVSKTYWDLVRFVGSLVRFAGDLAHFLRDLVRYGLQLVPVDFVGVVDVAEEEGVARDGCAGGAAVVCGEHFLYPFGIPASCADFQQ